MFNLQFQIFWVPRWSHILRASALFEAAIAYSLEQSLTLRADSFATNFEQVLFCSGYYSKDIIRLDLE